MQHTLFQVVGIFLYAEIRLLVLNSRAISSADINMFHRSKTLRKQLPTTSAIDDLQHVSLVLYKRLIVVSTKKRTLTSISYTCYIRLHVCKHNS